ncbi:MAG TPA: hypothetical protein VHB79_38875 [Polyangiaceae bacterium]|nr:hypothetical protein [Polyangiaceae bacterium]
MNGIRRVDDGADEDMVAMGAGWFISAFDVAIGNSRAEVLDRFSDDLRALINAVESDDSLIRIDADEFLKRVEQLQFRMSVAAEWAERLERLERLSERGGR